MTSFVKHTCPYTLSENMTFMLIADTVDKDGAHIYEALGVCQGCNRGVLFTLGATQDPRNTIRPSKVGGDIDKYFVVGNTYPELPENEAPAHTPETVADAFQEATKALNAGLFTPCGIMARKVVDLATKHLKPDTKKGTPLQRRIDLLRDEGLITEALKVMAHVVRLDGNGAAHEEDAFAKEEAELLLEFARLFLTLTFTVNGEAAKVAAEKHPQLLTSG